MQFNNAFFTRLGRSPKVVGLVMGIAHDVAGTAKADGPKDTHAYVDGIEVRQKFQDRVVGEVVGTDRKTMLVEAKTANLLRALLKHRRGRG